MPAALGFPLVVVAVVGLVTLLVMRPRTACVLLAFPISAAGAEGASPALVFVRHGAVLSGPAFHGMLERQGLRERHMTYFPVQDYGPLMKGLVIGGLGIFHVFLAQFAIGGGILLCRFQWLAMRGREPAAREFLDGYFKFLVLVSFVVGALTGVGMWFTAIQVSPRTIGLMVDEFHWIWAAEWTFFCLEVVAGYAFLKCGARLNDRQRLRLLLIYTASAWMSLFWINGILSFQLSPGGWQPEERNVWSGFFNPTFWPQLLFRTIACLAIAALVACIVINAMKVARGTRRRLIRHAAGLLVPMAAMPVVGLWFFLALPEPARAWLLGGSVAMSMFFALAVGSSLLVGAYVLLAIIKGRLLVNGATATLLTVLAFAASAGGEFIREGVRKPFTVHGRLYSNSITPEAVASLRVTGSVTADPYPIRDAQDYPDDWLRLGRKVYRAQCAVCHSVDGVNGLTHLMASWTTDQKRLNVAQLQRTKNFMPPFAGTPGEVEALVRWVEWEVSGREEVERAPPDDETLRRIREWLDEAGTAPGVGETR